MLQMMFSLISLISRGFCCCCFISFQQDYIDAFEKLLHLAIKEQKIIVSVIIHCCLSENTFNPYYAAVARKFCDYDRKYQVIFNSQ